MPIICALAFALATAAAPAAIPSAISPVIVDVMAASDIPSSIVSVALREVDAVWRDTGIRFSWQRRGELRSSTALRVLIGGGLSTPTRAGEMPLGWITFASDDTPRPQIYMSYKNALELLKQSKLFDGDFALMPSAQRDTLLGRALGRALAHEIGHYLLASKSHGGAGLMMAVHTSVELFGLERKRFGISADEQAQLHSMRTANFMASVQ